MDALPYVPTPKIEQQSKKRRRTKSSYEFLNFATPYYKYYICMELKQTRDSGTHVYLYLPLACHTCRIYCPDHHRSPENGA